MDVKRLLTALAIGFGPLALAYTYAIVSSQTATGANIGASMILFPVMIVTPFLMIAAGAYYFMNK